MGYPILRAIWRRVIPIAVMVTAVAAAPIDTYKSDIELTSKDAGLKEISIGDVVADAMKASAKSDAAFIAASSFNEVTIAKGAFTAPDLQKALAYHDDSIVVVKLSGEQVLQALEHGLYLYPKISNSGFLQLSGLTVTVDPDAEKERHVASVKVGGDQLEMRKTYRVAMPAPLANGALAYFKVWKKADIDHDTGKTLETAVTDFLGQHKTIAKSEDRIVNKGK